MIPKKLLAKMLILHSDSAWLKAQHYKNNIINWTNSLREYSWKWLLNNIESVSFTNFIKMITPFYNS